jgi:hypothetical protein
MLVNEDSSSPIAGRPCSTLAMNHSVRVALLKGSLGTGDSRKLVLDFQAGQQQRLLESRQSACHNFS